VKARAKKLVSYGENSTTHFNVEGGDPPVPSQKKKEGLTGKRGARFPRI